MDDEKREKLKIFFFSISYVEEMEELWSVWTGRGRRRGKEISGGDWK